MSLSVLHTQLLVCDRLEYIVSNAAECGYEAYCHHGDVEGADQFVAEHNAALDELNAITPTLPQVELDANHLRWALPR